jgi:TorA maturation chaperone TorD
MNMRAEISEAELVFKEGLYSFLSSVFYSAPEEKQISALYERDVSDLITEVSMESTKFLLKPHKIEEVRQDFFDLFMVPGDKYVAPYESIYVDEKHLSGMGDKKLLMGPSAIRVKKFYSRAGFKFGSNARELPDFAGIELEFFASVIKELNNAIRSGAREEVDALEGIRKEFLKLHLKRWIPELCDKIFSKADTDFYRGVAVLAKQIILHEAVD